MDYKWVKLSKLSCFEKYELNILSCRACSWLSENHKIIQIGRTELKLWPLEHNSRHNHMHVYMQFTLTHHVHMYGHMHVHCMHIQSSPPSFCASERTQDLDALLRVINTAEQFVYIAVMDYFPAVIYQYPK